MCGIVGIVPRRTDKPELLEGLVRRMTEEIRHRGPNDTGFFITPKIALGMARLSIIDLDGSRQPIFTPDRSQAIVFNGEIYNYRALRAEFQQSGYSFSTQGDTEVALAAFHLHGKEGFKRLEGMFAITIWDAGTETLTLARDWLGQKSVYYAETDIGWIFASEIKALLAIGLLPRKPDLTALSHYMSFRHLPGSRTLFEGISKLPAAHCIEVTATTRSIERLWEPSYEPKWPQSEDTMLDELDELLKQVVAEHLISDVPLGAFLSGGIDSSLVVAYAANALREPLKTFSIGVDVDSQSELPWARKVAVQYGTDHFEKTVQANFASLSPAMVASLEEPVDPFAVGVYIVSQVTAEHVTVALGGDGGDELFAGYDRYIGQQFAESYARVPVAIRRRVFRPLIRRVPESFGYNSIAAKLRWLDDVSERDGVSRYAESAAFLRFPHSLKSALFTGEIWKTLGEEEGEGILGQYFSDGRVSSLVDKMLHTDCMTRLAEHQLPIVDRMAMAHSLEVRNPFLDRRVAEYAMRIPSHLKMKRRRIKYMTRKMGERYLPKDLLYRKKQGFGFPLGIWLRGELRGLIQMVVETSRMVEEGIFQREEMRRLLREHLEGQVDHSYRLWMLFNLELWYRHFIDLEPVQSLQEWVRESRVAA